MLCNMQLTCLINTTSLDQIGALWTQARYGLPWRYVNPQSTDVLSNGTGAATGEEVWFGDDW